MTIVGGTDGNSIVARCRLDPDVVEASLTLDAAVGDTVKADTPGDAEVLGPSGLTEPAGTVEQNGLGVILHPPRQILPVPKRRTCLPVAIEVGEPWLVEFSGPLRHLEDAVFEFNEGLCVIGPPVRGQSHDFPALIPVAEDVAGNAAIQGAQARHEIEFIAEEAAYGIEPHLAQRLQL